MNHINTLKELVYNQGLNILLQRMAVKLDDNQIRQILYLYKKYNTMKPPFYETKWYFIILLSFIILSLWLVSPYLIIIIKYLFYGTLS
jgi:hypothetical protein